MIPPPEKPWQPDRVIQRNANGSSREALTSGALASAWNTVSGACAITASSALAGPRGARSPCSQLRMVSTGTPSLAAKLHLGKGRRGGAGRAPRAGPRQPALRLLAGWSGHSCPSRNSTIRPSAFSRNRMLHSPSGAMMQQVA